MEFDCESLELLYKEREVARDREVVMMNREAGKLQPHFEKLYSQYTTRKLLSMRREHYGVGTEYDQGPTVEETAKWYALKKVLSKRPHILNKPEEKEIRQENARRNRGNSKGRNR